MEAQVKPKRTFYGKVAIVGPTGSGKSYMSKTADRASTGYINSELQPLPYREHGFKHFEEPKTWDEFIGVIQKYKNDTEIKRIIIDSQTMALQRLNHECRTLHQNWDIAKNYNKRVYAYLELLKSIDKDIIVFSHDEFVKIDDGTKQKRMVVHNKEYEGKLEQHFVIVLYTGTKLVDKRPKYFLKTYEQDTSAKCPEELFPTSGSDKNNLLEIPNDANYIFNALEKYYSQ